MAICPNLSDKQVKRDFAELVNQFGEPMAYWLWNKNNGNALDKNSDGTITEFYNKLFDKVNDRPKVLNVIANLLIQQDSSEADFMESEMSEREFKPSKASLNRNNVPRIPRITIKNRYVKSAIEENSYIDSIRPSETKRYITNMYFRYVDGSGKLTSPHYPYTTGTPANDVIYIRKINSEFESPVVKYNADKGVIEFTDNVDIIMSVGEAEEILIRERGEVQDADNIVGDYEPDFLTVDPDPNKKAQTKKQQDLNAKLETYQEIIKRKKEFVRLIKQRVSKGSIKRSDAEATISMLNTQIKNLEEQQNDRVVIEQAKEDNIIIHNRLINIAANLERADSLDENQLAGLISELNEISVFIRGWADITDLLDYRDFPELRDEIKLLGAEIRERASQHTALLNRAFFEHSNKTSFRKFTEVDLYGAVRDEGTLSRYVLGAQFSGSNIVKVVADHINKSAYDINREFYEKKLIFQEWLDRLKQHTGLKSNLEISELFLQYDDKGNWTGNLVGRVKQEFYDKKIALRKTAQESGLDADWKKYYHFIQTNSVEITEEIYKARKHPSFTEKDFEMQDKLMQRYEQNRESYVNALRTSGLFGDVVNGVFEFDEATKPRYDQLVAEWERLNSPWLNVKGGNNRAYRVFEKPDLSKWGDSKYDKIQKDPVLKEFYEFYLSSLGQNNEELPSYDRAQSNYLPELRKTPAELFTEDKGVMTAMGLLNDELLKSFMEATDSEIEHDITIAGETYKTVRTSMMSDYLNPAEKSKDIFNVLLVHTKMALNYKYKSQIEPMAQAAQQLIQEVKGIKEVSKDGQIIAKEDRFGQVISNEKNLENTRKRLTYLINSAIYGERRAKEVVGKKEHTLKTGEKVAFSTGKTIDSLIKFTYVKAFSLPNIVTPSVNILLGLTQNFIYAAAGKHIDNASLYWAYSKIVPSSAKSFGKIINREDLEMVIAWMRDLNILDDINESAYGEAQSWDRWLTILQSKAEYINQGAVMLAYLKKNKLKDKNGNEVSIIDAYKIVNGAPVWNTDKMGEQTQPKANEVFSEDMRGVNMFRLRMKIKGINFYIHGDYSSALEGKHTSWGRAAMLFKTWLFQTWMHRFGAEREDMNLQETVKGRYRSYLKVHTMEGLELNYKQIAGLVLKGLFSKRAFNTLSEIDKVNLMRNVREIQFIVGMYGVVAMLMLAGGAGDDDEESAFLMKNLNLATNLMNKTQSDLMFYMNPGSTGQVLNNLIPLISTVNDLMGVGRALSKTVTGSPYYESGPWKDYARIPVAIGRSLPIGNGGYKIHNLMSEVYQYN